MTLKEYADRINKLVEQCPNVEVVAQDELGQPTDVCGPTPCTYTEDEIIFYDWTKNFVVEAVCVN